jgi:hypothetical protein
VRSSIIPVWLLFACAAGSYGADDPIKEITYPTSADNTRQPAMFYDPGGKEPRPLLVALHTWSWTYKGKYNQYGGRWCVKNRWVFIYPNFRGPNNRPEATGSELVVKDIISAVEYARKNAKVDETRIYLVGCSGGGYTSLLMAGRAPDIWAGVSAWVPISDLIEWHRDGKEGRGGYWQAIEKSCGGNPMTDKKAKVEAVKRSPVTYLKNAKNVPIDIYGGINDRTVPCTHSLRAFNAVADEKDRLSEEEIRYFLEKHAVPPKLKKTCTAPGWKDGEILFRRTSGKVRVTIFNGGHSMDTGKALTWMKEQRKGRAPKTRTAGS